MGCHENITAEKFPKQGKWLGKEVNVCFHYQEPYFLATVIRDDDEAPFLTIFKLVDSGNVILSTECQYRPPAS